MSRGHKQFIMSQIFALSHYHYEDSSTYLFTGPDNISQEQFRDLCYRLLDQAAVDTIINEKKSKYSCSIGWRDVVESMVPLLEKQGYHCLKPIEVYFGGGLINDARPDRQNIDDEKLSNHIFTAILNFNKNLTESHK